MTTLLIPHSLERRLLNTVREEAEGEPVRRWPEESLQLCLALLRQIQDNTAKSRQSLEGAIAHGEGTPALPATWLPQVDAFLAMTREIIEVVAASEDAPTEQLLYGLHCLEQEIQAVRAILLSVEPQANGATDGTMEDPTVTLPPGLRPLQLTEEAAAEMRRLLDDPNQKRYTGREIPTADPSTLRKKKR